MGLKGALEAFYSEAQELLEAMESALLRLDEGEYDSDLLNDIFRSAHTIKGSAGIFALEHIVDFTHIVESILDRARDNEIRIEGELLDLIFKCRDHLAQLVECDNDAFAENTDLQTSSESLIKSLKPWFKPDAYSNVAPANLSAQTTDKSALESWHISLRLASDCLKNGMDPLSFVSFLDGLGKITHIEVLDDALPEPGAEFDPETLYLAYEITLETDAGQETIEKAFAFVQEGSNIKILPADSQIEQFIALIESLPEENQRLGEILVKSGAISQEALDAALNQQANSADGRQLGELLEADRGLPKQVIEAAVEKQKSNGPATGSGSQLIRVDAECLDHVINVIGEIVLSKQRLDMLINQSGDEGLRDAAHTLGEFTEELRDAALKMRMVKIGSTFQRFKRIVRDTSQELGKEIELVLEGADTELDRLMVEKLTDPLTHIVRNAIDHGIESVEQRRAAGKPDQGTLKMEAYHEAGHIVIEVSDDGGGIVPASIRQKAIEKGLITDAAELTEYEALQLIFQPGFSTTNSVTSLSGRGVGMDVVKRNVEALHGYIDVLNDVGEGTTFKISLPLTLAIIDGFHVRSGKTHFIVPQSAVIECTNLKSCQDKNERDCVNLRGEMVPFLSLSEIFKLPAYEKESQKKASWLFLRETQRDNLLIVQFGDERAGIVVDELHGEVQTVVKSLGPILKPLKGVGGSSLLGNGEIAFILDIPQLVSLVIAKEVKEVKEI